MTHAETRRQLVHLAMGGFALALPWLTWWQAAACALAALVLNLLVLPRLARTLFRTSELEGRLLGGIVFYPLAVLLLVLVFPDRLDIVAIAWSVLAAGDSAATLVGRAVGGPRLGWNREKTWAGSVAFVVAGGAASTLLAWWMRNAVSPVPPAWFTWVTPWLAATAAALVESLPARLDDNLSAPAAAAAAAWALSKIDPSILAANVPLLASRVLPAVAVNGIAAVLGYRAGTVTVAGMAVGFATGVLIWLGSGPAGWALLFGSFLVAVLASRVGLDRKVVLGIAEARGGRRGAGNTIANCGLATVAALMVVARPDPALPLLVLVTALVSGASDTVSSEVGKAFGTTTLLVTTLRRVAPGTSGAISFEGTLAGIVAAFALGAMGAAAGLVPFASILLVVVGATIGSLVESGLGATLEAPGVLNNDMLNFLNTVVSALAAAVLARSLS